MDQPNTDLIQGTLDMLILKSLSLEPMHGFGIARRIEQVSRGVFKVNPGSLLTAFQRLERMVLAAGAPAPTTTTATAPKTTSSARHLRPASSFALPLPFNTTTN